MYGTLRKGLDNAMSNWLRDHVDYAGCGTYNGELYLVDYYPGATPSQIKDSLVHGDLYNIRDPLMVLNELDAYEEYGPDFPQPNEYVRTIQSIHTTHGDIKAWMYMYNRPTHLLKRIKSGDFVAYEKSGQLI